MLYHLPLFSNAENGADMTIESDTGYTPMALAVALGHKRGMCHFVTLNKYNYNFYNHTFKGKLKKFN